jgi:hypothetical protein
MQNINSVLLGVLDPNADTRRTAESLLTAGSSQPGFAMALLSVALTHSDPPPLRQLALVLLKKHIREHWTFESSHFMEPPISDEEKAQVRAALPSGLSDPVSALRTAVSMAIASVAQWDCPQAWPELVPGLVQAISQKDNPHLGEESGCLGWFSCIDGYQYYSQTIRWLWKPMPSSAFMVPYVALSVQSTARSRASACLLTSSARTRLWPSPQ